MIEPQEPHTVVVFRNGEPQYITFGAIPAANVSSELRCEVATTPTPADAVKTAHELGRLDVVSIYLGGLGLLIGTAAIIGFGVFRREAREVARETAESEARDTAEPIARSVAEDVAARTTVQFLRDMRSFEESNDVDETDADSIAAAQDE